MDDIKRPYDISCLVRSSNAPYLGSTRSGTPNLHGQGQKSSKHEKHTVYYNASRLYSPIVVSKSRAPFRRKTLPCLGASPVPGLIGSGSSSRMDQTKHQTCTMLTFASIPSVLTPPFMYNLRSRQIKISFDSSLGRLHPWILINLMSKSPLRFPLT